MGATYWSLGIWGFPLIAILFLVVDAYLRKKDWFGRNVGKYMMAASVSGMLLYYPVLILVWMVAFHLLGVGQ